MVSIPCRRHRRDNPPPLCSEFLERIIGGLLRVELEGVLPVPTASPWLGSDPCVQLAVGESTASIGWQEREPCTLFVRDPARQMIRLRMLDSSSGGASQSNNEHLGSAVQGLEDVCDGQQHVVELQLRGGSCGGSNSTEECSVRLRCRFVATAEALAEAAHQPDGIQPLSGGPQKVRWVLGAMGWQSCRITGSLLTHMCPG